VELTYVGVFSRERAYDHPMLIYGAHQILLTDVPLKRDCDDANAVDMAGVFHFYIR